MIGSYALLEATRPMANVPATENGRYGSLLGRIKRATSSASSGLRKVMVASMGRQDLRMRNAINRIHRSPQIAYDGTSPRCRSQDGSRPKRHFICETGEIRGCIPYLGFNTAQGTNISSSDIPPCWNVCR